MFIRMELVRGNNAKMTNVDSYAFKDGVMEICVRDAKRIIPISNILYCDILPDKAADDGEVKDEA